MDANRPGAARRGPRRHGLAGAGSSDVCQIPVRSSIEFVQKSVVRANGNEHSTTLLTAVRRCLVCDFVEERTEPESEDLIGSPCRRCQAPTERVEVLKRRSVRHEPNPHAAALGRLGGLKGGPARAAALTAKRRREIAKTAARARWRK